MRLKSLFTISVFLSTILALLALSSFVDSKTPVQAAASDPAKLFVIVQNGAGTRITNATVTLTVGKVVSPQWCNYAGKNGTWTATKVLWNGLTEYWFYQSSGVVLQICCNASSFTLSVSAPGYISKTLNVSLAGYNGSYKDQYVTLSPTLPDLVIRNTGGGTVPPIISGPTSLVVGQSGTYQARTRNAGAGVAAASTTKFSAGSSSNPQDLFAVAALGSGRNSAIHSSTTSWSSPGTYAVSFLADRDGVVTEANEGNNTATLTVTVKAQPDLVIRNGAGGTSPAINGPTTLSAGQSASYTARTKNIGTAAAAASTTRAWTSGSTHDTVNFAPGSLAANTSSAIHTFTTSWNTPGNYTVSFKADNAGVVAESSEGNNTSSITVTVRGVDLVIRNETGGDTPSITGPTTLAVGQNGTFTAVTKNIGEGVAAASTTRASTTNSSNDSTDFPVSSLDTNKSSSVHSFTTSWSTPGNHTVTFRADNGNVVTENTEGNNTASITVNIPEPPSDECRVTATPSRITDVDRTTTITAEGLDPNKQYRFILSSVEGTVYVNEIHTSDASGKVTYVQSFQYYDGSTVKDLPLGQYKIEYYPLADPSKKCTARVTLFEVVYVEEPPPDPVIPTPFGPVCGTAICLAEAVLNTGLGVVGGVAFLLMVLGAYRLIFAGGNPESVKNGREIFTAAVLGLVVVVFAIFILNLLGIGILGLKII